MLKKYWNHAESRLSQHWLYKSQYKDLEELENRDIDKLKL